jgi:hypothetical protein
MFFIFSLELSLSILPNIECYLRIVALREPVAIKSMVF